MPDDVTLVAGGNATPQAGTVVATDEVGGKHYQKVKLALGAADEAILVDNGQQSMANSVPVAIASDQSDVPTHPSHTRNEAFKEAAAIGGELDDTAPVDATEGNVSPVRITAKRAVHVNLRKNDGTELGTATDPARVDPTGTTKQPVHGDVAHDSPDAGDPVKIGGRADANAAPGPVASGDRVNSTYDPYGRQLVTLGDSQGTPGADGETQALKLAKFNSAEFRPLYVMNGAFNGATIDRWRNNFEAPLLASAARTATTNSPDQTNHNVRGFALILNVTANPGAAETLSLKIQAKDPVSGSYVDVVDFGVIVTAANGTFYVIAYPGIADADHVAAVVAKSAVLPRTWRAVVTHSAAGSWTYSLAAMAIQ